MVREETTRFTITQLRRYRRAKGFSQAQVARALDLSSPTSISRWERGERIPTPAHLLELSALYQRMVNDLLLPQYRDAQRRVYKRLRTMNTKRDDP